MYSTELETSLPFWKRASETVRGNPGATHLCTSGKMLPATRPISSSISEAAFPIEPHGFREPSSWLDEYRRIFKLFQENLGEATP